MAHPKRKTSKSRKKKRRTHHKLKVNNLLLFLQKDTNNWSWFIGRNLKKEGLKFR